MSWTQPQFQKALRTAGWKRDKHGQGVYYHPAGGKFYSWTWYTGIAAHFDTGEVWAFFAKFELLPHPKLCGIIPRAEDIQCF